MRVIPRGRFHVGLFRTAYLGLSLQRRGAQIAVNSGGGASVGCQVRHPGTNRRRWILAVQHRVQARAGGRHSLISAWAREVCGTAIVGRHTDVRSDLWRTSGTLRTLRPYESHRSRWPGRTRRSLRTSCSSQTCWPLRSGRPLSPWRSLRSGWPLRSGRPTPTVCSERKVVIVGHRVWPECRT